MKLIIIIILLLLLTIYWLHDKKYNNYPISNKKYDFDLSDSDHSFIDYLNNNNIDENNDNDSNFSNFSIVSN
jgi:hypothetical protein